MTQALPYSERKIITSLFASQSLVSASGILVFTVASIEAVRLAGGDKGWTGVPSTVQLIGQAAIAYPIGRLMDRIGRRWGLSIGYLLGIMGGAVAGWGALGGSLPLFLAGIFGIGLSWGALDLSRYAAADSVLPDRRARAISLVVLGGTVGSVFGPWLIALAPSVAARFGLPESAGLWLLVGFFLALGFLVVMTFLRPDPAQIARHIAAQAVHTTQPAPVPAAARSYWAMLRDPRIALSAGALIFSQLAMVTVMTITPVHMKGHQHPLEDVSVVLMAHTVGMYGLSFVTGWLADRIGRAAVVLIGGLMLSAACIIAPFSTGTAWLIAALFLLGLGWNFSFVAGSTLLDESLGAAEKGIGRGSTDALVKVASGMGSLGSGLLFAATSYALTSWLTIMVAVLPAMLAFWLGLMRRPLAAASGR